MKHRRQSYSSCFAYALWQIEAVSEAAVREYEQLKAFESWGSLHSWLDSFLPELSGLRLNSDWRVPSSTTFKGKGIIGLYDRCLNTAHAISYEDGVVLDPDAEEEMLSLEEYLKLNPRWEVVKIIPVGEDKCTPPTAD